MLHRPLPDTTRSLGDRTSESIYLRSPWYLILGYLAQVNPSQNAAHDVDRRCPARVGEGTELIEDLGNVLRSDDGTAPPARRVPEGGRGEQHRVRRAEGHVPADEPERRYDAEAGHGLAQERRAAP